jgi:hypothetical protein
MSAAYFAAEYHSCLGPLYFLDVVNQRCIDTTLCDGGWYYDIGDGTCESCEVEGCTLCYGVGDCVACNGTLFWTLAGSSC